MFPNGYMSIASNPFTKLCSGNKSHAPPPFEWTYDLGEWYRQSVQGQTAGEKAKESTPIGKKYKSATCATGDTDYNESDWETCNDGSEEISTDESNWHPTSGHVRRDVTNNNHKTPSTTAPSNKITDDENTASEFPPSEQSERPARPLRQQLPLPTTLNAMASNLFTPIQPTLFISDNPINPYIWLPILIHWFSFILFYFYFLLCFPYLFSHLAFSSSSFSVSEIETWKLEKKNFIVYLKWGILAAIREMVGKFKHVKQDNTLQKLLGNLFSSTLLFLSPSWRRRLGGGGGERLSPSQNPDWTAGTPSNYCWLIRLRFRRSLPRGSTNLPARVVPIPGKVANCKTGNTRGEFYTDCIDATGGIQRQRGKFTSGFYSDNNADEAFFASFIILWIGALWSRLVLIRGRCPMISRCWFAKRQLVGYWWQRILRASHGFAVPLFIVG